MKKLSPTDFYEVRNSLGLSLSSVAKEAGINRNYLSNFEKKKYFLDDTAKAKLRDFYLSLDPTAFDSVGSQDETQPDTLETVTESNKKHRRSAVSALSEMGFRLVDDRYVVPSATDEEIIEECRERMNSIDDELSNLLLEPLPVKESKTFDFFSDGELKISKREALQRAVRALTLLSQKQLHHEAMQGSELLHANDLQGDGWDFHDTNLENLTVGDLVLRFLHPDNQLLSEME